MRKNIMRNPSLDFLRTQLTYCPDSGIFTWNVNGKGPHKRAGEIAGGLSYYGYVRIKVIGKWHAGHRLAWLFMTGSWPTKEIDHINRVRADNRFCNLREATASQNKQNTLGQSRRKSRYKGVIKEHKSPRWLATIKEDGVIKRLGNFDTEEEAGEAYKAYVNLVKGEYSPWHGE